MTFVEWLGKKFFPHLLPSAREALVIRLLEINGHGNLVTAICRGALSTRYQYSR